MRHIRDCVIVALVGLSLWMSAENVTRLSHDESGQRLNSAYNVESWCGEINRGNDYNRGFSNQSVKSAKKQGAELEKAIHGKAGLGLTRKERAFLDLFVHSVIRLEQRSPVVLKIHSYTLTDLDCKGLIRKTLESPKHHDRVEAHPLVEEVLRER